MLTSVENTQKQLSEITESQSLNDTILLTNTVPYLSRRALSVANASPYVKEKIVGGSVAWNQLIQNGDFGYTDLWGLVSATWSVANNVANVTFSAQYARLEQLISIIQGHKYLEYCEIKKSKADANITLGLYYAETAVSQNTTDWQTLVCIGIPTQSETHASLRIITSDTSNWGSVQIRNVMVTDLTLAFGTTIADYIYSLEQSTPGAGVAKLKEWGFFTKEYYEYNAGSIQSVKTSGKNVVGKNLFKADPVSSSGITVTNNNGVITCNGVSTGYPAAVYIGSAKQTTSRILKMYLQRTITSNFRIVFYLYYKGDVVASYVEETWVETDTEWLFDFSSYNFDEVKWYLIVGNGESINGTVSPMITFPDVNDDTFEPSQSITYPLSPIELRGIPKLDAQNNLYYSGDVYESSGKVTRKYGIVDLGTLTWTKQDISSGHWNFNTADLSSVMQFPSNTNLITGLVICQKYAEYAADYLYSTPNVIGLGLNNSTYRTLHIYDTTYTDAATFKSAMSGVYLVYKLSTYTEELAAPFTSPQSLDGATFEEYLDSRTVPIPVGHITDYMGPSNDEFMKFPSTPDDGEYLLSNTVSGGKGFLTWQHNMQFETEQIHDKCLLMRFGKLRILQLDVIASGLTIAMALKETDYPAVSLTTCLAWSGADFYRMVTISTDGTIHVNGSYPTGGYVTWFVK